MSRTGWIREITQQCMIASVLFQFWFSVFCGSPLLAIQSSDPFQTSPNKDSAESLLNRGQYIEAIAAAQVRQKELGRFGIDESLPVLIARAQMSIGAYEDALKTVEEGLERYENSIRIRWVGATAAKFNNQVDRSLKFLSEIESLAKSSAWRFRDNANQLVLGRYYLSKGADAKQVMKAFYRPALKRDANDIEVYRAIGQLSIDKGDFSLAAENYRQLIKIAPEDSDAHFQLARCFLRSNLEVANEEIKRTLVIHPRHEAARLLLVDQRISSENYEAAIKLIDEVLSVNPFSPPALAYRAAIAHLQNNMKQESKLRKKALQCWPGNPEVDHIIGRELSEKYRFAEGQKYQRRALIYDGSYLPAKIQLAHDLLRLGQEMEGWKLADEVFNRDQYNVLAHNLLTLRDEMTKFKTLSKGQFIVRMSPAEASFYGDRVLQLLDRASEQLTKKYQVELETPVVIEIFPQQKDFAVRTFGLPGGEGFLGVCFGRVITMNSPAAQGASLTSWESVLWHEFCHVVTLQKTKNKMPRWLSEGISVYEEKLEDSAWGESMSRRYRDMLLEELTPVSQLSGAFLRPPSPIHLQFAYYESSLVVQYIIDNHGLPKLVEILNELSIGTPINQALAEHLEPIEELDKNFKAFAVKLANQFAPQVDWSQPESIPEDAGVDYWVAWNQSHPNSMVGLMNEASQRIEREEYDEALKLLKQARTLCPEDPSPYPALAIVYRKLEKEDLEYKTLKEYSAVEASDSNLYLRLLELDQQNKDWESMREHANRLIAVNPIIKPPHKYLAMASESLGDNASTVKALKVLAVMDPLDPADVRFRLAQAYYKLGETENALREVLLSLEQAPRYRDAHQLLLKIKQEPNDKNEKQNLDAKESE